MMNTILEVIGLDSLVELDDKRQVPAINLDNAATTPAFKLVAEEINRQLLFYGSIGRGKGQKSEHSSKIYSAGRDIVKDFVGAKSDRYTVFYVNSTTDGMNKLASALIESPEDIVLTTRMEHHANDLPWRERVTTLYAEVDSKGRLIIEDLERILSDQNGKVRYVSVTAASNVTGYVNDVHRIAKIAHKYGAQIIVDGAQIVAHRAFSMLGNTPEEHIDYFVFSAHKMYSPYGGGAVVGLEETLSERLPVFYGGGMVKTVMDDKVIYNDLPDRYEAGSPNYLGVVGMLKAIEILCTADFNAIKEHEQRLIKKTLAGLKTIPGVILYGDNDQVSDRVGIIVFNLQDITNETVANKLAGRRGIAVRHAAFCAHPYVRRLAEHEAERENTVDGCFPPEGMVRISFGIYNTDADVDALIETLHLILNDKTSYAVQNTDISTQPNDRG